MTDNGRMEARDYWREESHSINVLEAKALLCALDAFKTRIRNSGIDVHTDSRALLGSWQSKAGNNSKINDVIKAILQCSQEFNFLINIQYVPLAGNPADALSRWHSFDFIFFFCCNSGLVPKTANMGPLGFSLSLLTDGITNFVKTSILPTYNSFLQVACPWKAAWRCTLHQQKPLLLQLSNLVWTCQRSIAIS